MPSATGHITVRRSAKEGCILRVSEWAVGIEYHNDKALTSGTRYLDIAVKTTGPNTFNAYECKRTHTSSASIPVTNTTYWQPFNNLQPIYTPLIIAQNALLKFAQTNQLLVMDADGTTIVAGLGGGDYPLWIGNTQPNGATFKVSKAGKLFATGAEVSGVITSEYTTMMHRVVIDSFNGGIICSGPTSIDQNNPPYPDVSAVYAKTVEIGWGYFSGSTPSSGYSSAGKVGVYIAAHPEFNIEIGPEEITLNGYLCQLSITPKLVTYRERWAGTPSGQWDESYVAEWKSIISALAE